MFNKLQTGVANCMIPHLGLQICVKTFFDSYKIKISVLKETAFTVNVSICTVLLKSTRIRSIFLRIKKMILNIIVKGGMIYVCMCGE